MYLVHALRPNCPIDIPGRCPVRHFVSFAAVTNEDSHRGGQLRQRVRADLSALLFQEHVIEHV